MFGISKHEIMARIAQKATQDIKEKGFVKIDKFGTLSYNKEEDTWKFYPDLELEQAVKRTGAV